MTDEAFESETPPDAGDAPVAASAPRSRGRVIALVLVIVAVVVLSDQLTKWWAVHSLADGPVDVIGTTVQFVLAFNSGSAFSLFQGFTPLLAVIAIGIAIVLIRMLRKASDPWTVVALALILGGALGNLGDRIFRASGFMNGHVVDFIKVGWWPVFNIADAAVTVGVILLVIRSFRRHD